MEQLANAVLETSFTEGHATGFLFSRDGKQARICTTCHESSARGMQFTQHIAGTNPFAPKQRENIRIDPKPVVEGSSVVFTPQDERVLLSHALATAGPGDIRVGQHVYFAGHAFGQGLKVHSGKISQCLWRGDRACISIDGTAVRGMSGGPVCIVVDGQFRVVGTILDIVFDPSLKFPEAREKLTHLLKKRKVADEYANQSKRNKSNAIQNNDNFTKCVIRNLPGIFQIHHGLRKFVSHHCSDLLKETDWRDFREDIADKICSQFGDCTIWTVDGNVANNLRQCLINGKVLSNKGEILSKDIDKVTEALSSSKKFTNSAQLVVEHLRTSNRWRYNDPIPMFAPAALTKWLRDNVDLAELLKNSRWHDFRANIAEQHRGGAPLSRIQVHLTKDQLSTLRDKLVSGHVIDKAGTVLTHEILNIQQALEKSPWPNSAELLQHALLGFHQNATSKPDSKGAPLDDLGVVVAFMETLQASFSTGMFMAELLQQPTPSKGSAASSVRNSEGTSDITFPIARFSLSNSSKQNAHEFVALRDVVKGMMPNFRIALQAAQRRKIEVGGFILYNVDTGSVRAKFQPPCRGRPTHRGIMLRPWKDYLKLDPGVHCLGYFHAHPFDTPAAGHPSDADVRNASGDTATEADRNLYNFVITAITSQPPNGYKNADEYFVKEQDGIRICLIKNRATRQDGITESTGVST